MPEQESREEKMLDLSLKRLLHNYFHNSQPNSKEALYMAQVISAKNTIIVSESIDRFTTSNNKLSKQILNLNIILGFFTIVGTVLTVIALFKD